MVQHGTATQDMRLNRIADQVAQQTLHALHDQLFGKWDKMVDVIFKHQTRRCHIAFETSKLRKYHQDADQNQVDNHQSEEQNISLHLLDLSVEHSAADFSICLQKRIWFPKPVESNYMEDIHATFSDAPKYFIYPS